MSYKRKVLFVISIIAAIAICIIFWRLEVARSFHFLKEGGEIPFIPVSNVWEEKEGKSIFLQKKPFEACVEMVMYYWGNPPTEEESRSLLAPISQGWSNAYPILKKHGFSFFWVASLNEETIGRILQLRVPIIAWCDLRRFWGAELPYLNTCFLIKEFKNGNFVFNDPKSIGDQKMPAYLFLNAYWRTTDTVAFLVFPPSKKKELKRVIPSYCFKELKELKGLIQPGEENYKEKLLKQLKRKTKRKTFSPYFAYLLGWHLIREGDIEGLQWLEKAYETSQEPFYRVEYAISHCYLHKDKEALKLLRELIKEEPQNLCLPTVFFHLCYLLSREGKVEEIKQMFQKASSMAPPHLLSSLVEIYSQVLPTYKEKIQLLQGFLSKYSWAKGLRNNIADLFRYLISEKRWSEAEQILINARAEGWPWQKEWFHLIKALKYLGEGKVKEAEELFNQIGDEHAYLKIYLLHAMGKKKEAQEKTRKFLTILKERFDSKANEIYETRVELYIRILPPLCDLITISVSLDDFKSAKEAIKEFLDIYENNVLLGYDLFACWCYAIGGMICYRDGEVEKAKEWLLKAYNSPYFKELGRKECGRIAAEVQETLKKLTKPNS
jgi:tetratricopeptide (TPR) repeat protein